jgi:alginate O-acetyltransferase complex protein AlgI
LIAGPIVRYHYIADQLRQRQITGESFAAGIHRFVIGLAKKVLIANVVARAADDIFALNAAGTPIGSGLAWLGIVCYTLQIFYDFSGYSDMAIGLGMMFGFRFPENFNLPYAARSIQDFWRRWHMTLSTWFRDYVYIPLGGNRKGVARTYLNLYIVFFLTGLWHGASWNFVLWGLLHGTFLVIERLGFDSVLEKMWRPVAHIYTLLVVMTAWVLFRADTLPQALAYLARMFGFIPENPAYPVNLYLDTPLALTLTAGVIFAMPVEAWFKTWRESYASTQLYKALALVRVGAMCGLFIFSAAALAVNTYNPFIYFRF